MSGLSARLSSSRMPRFDVVVLNHERLELFLRNFGRIRNFHPERDRVTVISCSPSQQETELIRAFEAKHDLEVRYLTRENRGIDQLARAEYFVGEVGSLEENLRHRFIFQFQEHYLDTEDPSSRWGEEEGFRVKGDVVPDDVIFDFDLMEGLADEHDLDGFFADRNNPCFIELDGSRYVAPCGGNFTIATRALIAPAVQEAVRTVISTCDDSYTWALYAEFMWGLIFFPEGRRFYDLKRNRVYTDWERDEFYIAPEDYEALMRRFGRSALHRALLRSTDRAKRALARVAR
jgi:hypothetical protein